MINYSFMAICLVLFGLTSNLSILIFVISLLGWLLGSTFVISISTSNIIANSIWSWRKFSRRSGTRHNVEWFLFPDIIRDKLGLHNVAFANGWFFFIGGLFIMTRPKAIGGYNEWFSEKSCEGGFGDLWLTESTHCGDKRNLYTAMSLGRVAHARLSYRSLPRKTWLVQPHHVPLGRLGRDDRANFRSRIFPWSQKKHFWLE